jgi:hypothetical protein
MFQTLNYDIKKKGCGEVKAPPPPTSSLTSSSITDMVDYIFVLVGVKVIGVALNKKRRVRASH